ncbi:MAG: alpha-L-fucosidase [Clostridia bacterium]|nr:alpha-L-fucosidase [Clostridia bacterium]
MSGVKKIWFDNASVALFVHWGLSTGNPDWKTNMLQFKTGEELEKAINDSGWKAENWVSMAKKIHAQYITLACFHCCMGSLRPFKCDIPGIYSTKRDFLGELIECATKENIKIVLYVGSKISQDLFDSDFVDNNAYCNYKGKDINLLSMYDFQRYFVKDFLVETLSNHPKIGGFWFDGFNNIEICNDLFKTIKDINPDVLVIKNNFAYEPIENEDVMSLEQFGKFSNPAYDYSSGSWHEHSNAEFCYTPIGDWWYDGIERVAPDKQFLIKQFISILASGWVPSIGFGPYLDGSFPDDINKFAEEINSLLNWAEPALIDIEKSSFEVYGINNTAYAFSTYNPSNNRHYVILTQKPKYDKFITFGDGCFNIKSIKNLKDNTIYSFNQKNGKVFVNCSDFVLLETDGVMIFEVEAKIMNEICNASVNINNDHAEICVHENEEISRIRITQFETSSTTIGGWGFPENKRIKSYSIYNNGDLISEGILSPFRGDKTIVLSKPVNGNLKFVINSHYYDNSKIIARKNGFWEKTIISNDVTSMASDSFGDIYFTDSKFNLYKADSYSVNLVERNFGTLAFSYDGTIRKNDSDVIFSVYTRNDAFKLMNDYKIYKNETLIFENATAFITSEDGDKLLAVFDGKLYDVFNGKVITQYECYLTDVGFFNANEIYVVDSNGNVYVDNWDGSNFTPLAHDCKKLFSDYFGRAWKIDKDLEYSNIKYIKLF